MVLRAPSEDYRECAQGLPTGTLRYSALLLAYLLRETCLLVCCLYLLQDEALVSRDAHLNPETPGRLHLFYLNASRWR